MLAILVIALLASTSLSAEVVYITSMQGWAYYKVRVSGLMTQTNIQAACVAEGMMYPCMRANLDCGGGLQWTADCPALPDGNGTDPAGACRVQVMMAQSACGIPEPYRCQPLDGTYIYIPGYSASEACGIDVAGPNWCVDGDVVSDLYATCVKEHVNECLNSPCNNGGVCADLPDGYLCICQAGWTGQNCQTEVDECASNPCQNGATCTDGLNGYICTCAPSWIGDHCENERPEVNLLHDNKCYRLSSDTANHADAQTSCSAIGGRLAIIKDAGVQAFLANEIRQGAGVSHWIGLKSSNVTFQHIDLSPLAGYTNWKPDEPAELCVLMEKDGDYKWTAEFCDSVHNYVCESAESPCRLNVCQNGGNCTACFEEDFVHCDCPPGFEGERCEIDTDECDSSPCQFGGTCKDGIDSFICSCLPGYTGDVCQTDIDLCNPNPCPFGWACVDTGPSLHCDAFGRDSPHVRAAVPYSCTKASCPDGMTCMEAGPGSYSCTVG
ncbi:fibropellin-1-like [Branchiostoma floridae]|uniref:Fibropellin-1-like n=1 Tax=Branchiostoma floridae TaxID=7739 RepID=A0A9J7KZT2_BRAFL|nr:fibropellin-1-like [Branchiostoma floridae]